ncbi:hypothetical protein [Glycomyces artemisiae]|uniref:Uncharacterized protein n=1 Tax=Glycomyces artemisiae TaxID=1076443 RepID=A0A2T0U6H7_9ACTN|nr:hypothetical protein [Glycomyces artemisiae]PRY53526.1 hypothetical protein B0I28_11725 [Glycomyces artemisiae]
MSRRSRNALLDNAVAIVGWIAVAALVAALLGYRQAWAVVVACLVVQLLAGGRIR